MPFLNVPLIAQWGSGANAFRLDCGPACVAMVLAYYGKLGAVTVDQLAKQTALAGGSQGLMPAQLVTLAAKHGLKTSVHASTTEADLRAQIDAGRPVIALIAYRFILGRLDQNDKVPGRDAHFVVVVGYDPDHFVLNDPDYWGSATARGHDYLVPVTQLEQAMAEYQGACVYMEESMGLGAQIADLARQIEALAARVNDTPQTPLTLTVYTIVNANIRSTPTVAGDTNRVPPGVAAGSALVVEQTPIKDADEHLSRLWYRIAAGQFAGNYVAVEVTSTTAPKA